MRCAFAALALLGMLVAACATAPDPRIEAARAYIREVTGDDLEVGAVGLRVTVQSASVDGRYLRIGGRIENRFTDPVEGVRYTIRLVSPGTPPRVLDTVYHEVGTSLAAGQSRIMRIEIENPVFASASGRFDIEADPVRLAGKDVPPPPGWK